MASPADRLQRKTVPGIVLALSRVRTPARAISALRRTFGRRGVVELFLAFDDPNSAVALVELDRRLQGRAVDLVVRPVVDRDLDDDPAVEAKREYAIADAARIARRSGLGLSRRDPIAPGAVAFLAEWVAEAGPSAEATEFAAAAARELWIAPEEAGSDSGTAATSPGPVPIPDRERFVDLWRRTVGGAPGAGSRDQVIANERRMKRAGAYAVPMATVHGRLFFAHDRLERIAYELDRLGWTAGGAAHADAPPNGATWRRAADVGGQPEGDRTVDFFFSYRSPYSYLAAHRAFELRDRFDIDLRFHGVTPMAMRGQSVPQPKRLHTIRDVGREAEALGMPFGPIWDPIGEGAERCLAIGVLAADRGRDRDWVLAVSRAIWSQAADVTDDAVLRPICEAAGLDWRECEAAIADPALAARVEADTDRLVAMGQWGVPVFVFRGEAFWGQDRIVDLELALAEAGLEAA